MGNSFKFDEYFNMLFQGNALSTHPRMKLHRILFRLIRVNYILFDIYNFKFLFLSFFLAIACIISVIFKGKTM